MNRTTFFFSRAGRSGPNDLAQRMPELASLRHATISVFGLGSLGAPSVMEFARSGVKELRIVDYDFVDPGTICRWPFGLQSAGLQKANVLADAISRDYPYTTAKPINYMVGVVRSAEIPSPSAQLTMEEITSGVDLIYDATAEIGVQQYLSDYAAELGIPYIGVDASPGGWGGRVVRIWPNSENGCWMCFRFAVNDGTIAEPPRDRRDEIQPLGCADPTFTGAGFDMLQIALTGVRTAVSTLCSRAAGGYPAMEWDVMTIGFRRDDGTLTPPEFRGYQLEKRAECFRCNPTRQ